MDRIARSSPRKAPRAAQGRDAPPTQRVSARRGLPGQRHHPPPPHDPGALLEGGQPVIRRILSAYAVEIIKQSRLLYPYFGPAFVLLAVAATLLRHPLSTDGSSDFEFIATAVPAALNIVGF